MYHNVTQTAWYGEQVDRERFDCEALDDEDPFEIDPLRAHLFKHEGLDLCDISEVWTDNPIFYPGREDGPADWLMVGEVTGDTVLVPLAAGSTPNKAKPIGVYKITGGNLDKVYKEDSK
jgi:hypothetical protein